MASILARYLSVAKNDSLLVYVDIGNYGDFEIEHRSDDYYYIVVEGLTIPCRTVQEIIDEVVSFYEITEKIENVICKIATKKFIPELDDYSHEIETVLWVK